MSNVAKWRCAPGEPTTARGWLYRNDLKDLRIDPREGFRFLKIGLVAFGFAGVVCHSHPHAAGMLAPIALGTTNLVFNKTRARKKPALRGAPEIGDAFDVRLTVRDAHGLRTGSDRGWLIFSDGWVLFEGARMDFAVTRGESYRRTHEPTLSLKLEDGRTVEFGAVGQPPLPRQLNRAFNAWEVAPIPDGEALLPPQETHPEVWASRHSLFVVGLILSVPTLGLGWAYRSPPLAMLGLLTCGGCLYFARLYTHRLRRALLKENPLPSSPPSRFRTANRGRTARDPEGPASRTDQESVEPRPVPVRPSPGAPPASL